MSKTQSMGRVINTPDVKAVSSFGAFDKDSTHEPFKLLESKTKKKINSWGKRLVSSE
jgi:hypothetical protein